MLDNVLTALNGEDAGTVFQSASAAQLGQSSPIWTPAARAYNRRGCDENGAGLGMSSSNASKLLFTYGQKCHVSELQLTSPRFCPGISYKVMYIKDTVKY